MRIIDERYKILFLSYTEPLYDQYLVEDVITHEKRSLIVFKLKVFNDNFARFIKEHFLRLTNLDNFLLEKVYCFRCIHSIDYELTDNSHILISENTRSEIEFFTYIKTCSFKQKIELFVSICQAVFFLHINKLDYAGVPIDAIQLCAANGTIQVKLKNLVMRKFHLYYKAGTAYKLTADDEPIVFSSDKQKDLYSLGLILLSILRDREVTAVSARDLKKFYPSEIKNKEKRERLRALLLKLILLKFNNSFGVNDIVCELSDIFETDFSVYDTQKINSRILFPDFYSGNLEMQFIISSAFERSAEINAENVFLIAGEPGVGKTRFLQELQIRLEFEKILTFSFFGIENETLSETCSRFLKQTNLFSMNNPNENLVVDLSYINDSKNKEWAKGYFDFFEQARKNIRNICYNRPIAILIDDIHYIKEIEFIKGMFFLTHKLKNLNVILVVSYDNRKNILETELFDQLRKLQPKNFYKKFTLKNLNPTVAKILINDMLHFKKLPSKFYTSFFLQSNGNPGKLTAFFKNLIINEQIIVNTKTGFSELSEDFANELKHKKIDSHLVIQNLNERISLLSHYDIEVIKYMSIFKDLIDEHWLFVDKQSAEKDNLINTLKQLEHGNIIASRQIDGHIKYFIPDYVLKDLIAKNLTTDEAKKFHRAAAKQIEATFEFSFAEEFAYQLKCSNQYSRARRYYLKLAIDYKRRKNIFAVIDCLIQALTCTDQTEKLFLIKLNLDLGTFYFEIGSFEKAKNHLLIALKLCNKLSNESLLIEVYVQLMFLFDLLFDKTELTFYMQAAEKIINVDPMKYPRSYAGILRMKSLMQLDHNHYKQAFALCEQVLEVANDRPGVLKEKSNALRIMSDVQCRMNNLDAAELALQESVKIADRIGHVRGILYSYVNFAFLYSLKKEKQKAWKYYRKTQTESIKYKMINSELLANYYIACYYFNSKQYQLSYKYALHGFQLARKSKMNESLIRLSFLLFHISLRMHKANDVKYYFSITKRFVVQGDLSIYSYDLYVTAAQYYAYFNDYAKAERNLKQILPFDSENCSIDIEDMTFYIEVLIFEITPTSELVDRIIKLISQNKNQNYKDLVEHCYHVFLAFLKKHHTKGMRKIFLIVINIDETEISLEERCKIYFISSFFERTNAKNYLFEILQKSFTFKLSILKIHTLIALGQLYLTEKNFRNALAFFIEAAIIIKQFVKKLPSEQGFSFFVGEKFYMVTENIKKLMRNETSGFYSYAMNNSFTVTHRYFSNFKKNDFKQLIPPNPDFYQSLAPAFLDLNIPLSSNQNYLDKFNTEIKNDIQTFLRKLAAESLATEAFIVVVKNKNDIDIVSHFSYLKKEPNLGLFYKITSSSEPIILNKIQLALLETKTDIQTAMTFPINRNTDQSHDREILAYVYLDSVYGINGIIRCGLPLLEKYKNFLGILIQGYSLYQRAMIDKLTKSLTRESLRQRIDEYSKRYAVFSILYYDIDMFKQVNDNYGHDVGDMVLSTISGVIKENLIEPECFGRQGGEEFIVCLPNATSAVAFERAEALRTAVEKIDFLGYNFHITISIGIATFGEHSRIIVDLIQKADHAMYYSKQTGKNRTTIWNQNLKQNILTPSGLAQISDVNNLWSTPTINFIIDILKLSNAKQRASDILKQYTERAKKILGAEYALIVFTDGTTVFNAQSIENIFGKQKPFWFSNILKFAQSKKSDVQFFCDFPANDSNAIFQNGVSLMLLPIFHREKFLGVACFAVQRSIKDFTAEDASIQTFALRMLSHTCNEVYKSLV